MESMKEEKFRPSWDDYFMAIARLVSTRSTCNRLQTGAVLVKNKRIVSTGYNGSPPGLEHCDDVGHLLEEGHCVRTIHGEHNVLLQAAVIGSSTTEGTTLYTVYSPCIHCSKYIVAAGVKRVVAGKIYRGTAAVEYLKEAGITVDIYTPTEGWGEAVSEMFSHDIEIREEGEVTFDVQ